MVRYFFLRTENRTPVGCVASKLDRANGKLLFNFSLANKKDKFDRLIARKVAEGRLENRPISIPIDGEKVSAHMLHTSIMEYFVKSDNFNGYQSPEIPYRAKKLAQLWLADKRAKQ